MAKTLEDTIHEADLPVPAPTGEEFTSYVSRVAHAAAFIGAAWAITNGPHPQPPRPREPGGPLTPSEEAEPVADPTFDNPITVDGQPAEERGTLDDVGDEFAREDSEPMNERPIHQDGPEHVVTER